MLGSRSFVSRVRSVVPRMVMPSIIMVGLVAGVASRLAAEPSAAPTALEEYERLSGLRRAASPVAPPPAAPAPLRVALVDVPTVWLLHPWMADYVFIEGSFTRELPATASPEERAAIFRQRVRTAQRIANEAGELRRRNLAEIQRIGLEEAGLTNQLNTEQERLRQQLRADLKKDPSRRLQLEEAFEKAMVAVEEKHFTRARELKKKTNALHAEMLAKVQEARNVGFLQPAEREERFAKIAAEIREAIKAEMKAGSYPVVLNRGYLAERIPQPKLDDVEYYPREPEAYVNEYNTFWNAKTDKADDQGGSLVEKSLERWLDRRSSVAALTAQGEDLFGFVIQGGEDITPAVVRRVLERHKVSQSRLNILMSIVSGRSTPGH